jgi:hypothetical protein
MRLFKEIGVSYFRYLGGGHIAYHILSPTKLGVHQIKDFINLNIKKGGNLVSAYI